MLKNLNWKDNFGFSLFFEETICWQLSTFWKLNNFFQFWFFFKFGFTFAFRMLLMFSLQIFKQNCRFWFFCLKSDKLGIFDFCEKWQVREAADVGSRFLIFRKFLRFACAEKWCWNAAFSVKTRNSIQNSIAAFSWSSRNSIQNSIAAFSESSRNSIQNSIAVKTLEIQFKIQLLLSIKI